MIYRRKPMMAYPNGVLGSLLGILVLVAGSNASAATVRRFDLEEMVETAERVFLGTCLSVQCERALSGISTRVVFRATERIKGTFDSDTVVLRLPGGVLNGVRCTIPGMPSFEPGEEVVAFLTVEDAEGYPWVVGLSQGKFSVITDPASQTKVVVNAASGAAPHRKSVNPDAMAGTEAPGVAGIAGVGLDAFLARIRGILAEQGETPGDDRLDVRTIEDSR